MSDAPHTQSIGELISTGLAQMSALFRSEIDLAKAEMSKKVTSASTAIGFLAVAGVLGIATTVLLLLTIATIAQAIGAGPVLSYLVATILGAGAAAGLAWTGIGHLRPSHLRQNGPSIRLNWIPPR